MLFTRLVLTITPLLNLAMAHPRSLDVATRELPYTVHNTSVADPSIAFTDNASAPLTVFHREAGDPKHPTIVLLHGYPASSHEYRNLIPLLAPHYHVLAPDYPGFGFTDQPSNLVYTFDNLANVVSAWLRALNATSYVLYVMDYGAPVGFRLALRDPAAVRGIVSQNGNAYVEGFGPDFAFLRNYYTDPSNATNEQLARDQTTYTGVAGQYYSGLNDAQKAQIAPESYTLDAARLARPGTVDVQLALFRSYASNEASYPAWQAYLREHSPPLLAVWGRLDLAFVPAGAEAFKRDVPNAEVELLDGGHFLVETKAGELARRILDFSWRKRLL